MADFLIDTNIVVDMVRRDEVALRWLSTVMEGTPGLVSIVWMEVLQGARDKDEMARLLKWLSGYEVIHLTEYDSVWALQQFVAFRLSHGVGIADCLIGAVAARMGLTLYTRNLKHYAPLLGVESVQPY